MNYNKVNNIFGWVAGIIALVVYLSTMEPTASFWDCGEFLSCAYKLEVGHSPGAPFFMLLQRLFAIFSGGNAITAGPSTHAAWAINALSPVMSALSVLFLFWTITHFARRLLVKAGETMDTNKMILIMGAGMVGALANTFSDTFWFSAVEAEVYATSSFFTAITLWAVLKWEEVADEKYADRWLILISYLLGISVCVHLLNLLTIPTVAIVYYFRRYKFSWSGFAIAFFAGIIALAFVQFGVIQYIPKIASQFDIMFTNGFGTPFDTGAMFFLVLLTGILVAGLLYARRSNNYLLHTGVLCIIFIIIGYSSYIVPIIRSRADVPIDMTNPDNPISFLDYVNREQFGQQPIFFGPYYTSRYEEIDTSGKLYTQVKANGKDRYAQVGTKMVPLYKGDQSHFFPRIWDGEGNHANFYMNFLGLKKGEEPSTADNFSFFFTYQMDWMWWRFFMWNFAGRQNDMEGQLVKDKGNWITGIPVLDQIRGLGNTDQMGEGYTTNGAHNKLYLLPFILGVMGLVFQFNRNRNDGIVVLMMFFFTGAAIGIFLNMPPLQPRERDYAFAGCTYTFTIWIGLGVLMLKDLFDRVIKGPGAVYASIGMSMLAVPVLMCNQEWDDHDRSHKTLATAVAHNTLDACAPNAILFTFGDNQTYPLWYAQEIEGYRKDVRVINTSLLGIDWYIDQLNYRVNDADVVPMMWKKENYIGSNHNYLTYYDNPQLKLPKNQYINLIDVCKFTNSSDPQFLAEQRSGEKVNYLPAKNFFVPVPSKDDLVKNGLAAAADTSRILAEMKFTYPKEVSYKSDLAVLNIIAAVAQDGWKRPLYFDAGLRQGDYAGTGDFMRLEGTVYRLMPYKVMDSVQRQSASLGTVNTEKSFDLYMHFDWGGAQRNDVFFDEPNRHELYSYRVQATTIATALIAEGKKDKAILLLDKVTSGISEHSYYYDVTGYFLAAAYYQAGAKEKAAKISKKVIGNMEGYLNWVSTLNDNSKSTVAYETTQQLRIMQFVGRDAYMAGDTATAMSINNTFNLYQSKFQDLIRAANAGAGGDE